MSKAGNKNGLKMLTAEERIRERAIADFALEMESFNREMRSKLREKYNYNPDRSDVSQVAIDINRDEVKNFLEIAEAKLIKTFNGRDPYRYIAPSRDEIQKAKEKYLAEGDDYLASPEFKALAYKLLEENTRKFIEGQNVVRGEIETLLRPLQKRGANLSKYFDRFHDAVKTGNADKNMTVHEVEGGKRRINTVGRGWVPPDGLSDLDKKDGEAIKAAAEKVFNLSSGGRDFANVPLKKELLLAVKNLYDLYEKYDSQNRHLPYETFLMVDEATRQANTQLSKIDIDLKNTDQFRTSLFNKLNRAKDLQLNLVKAREDRRLGKEEAAAIKDRSREIRQGIVSRASKLSYHGFTDANGKKLSAREIVENIIPRVMPNEASLAEYEQDVGEEALNKMIDDAFESFQQDVIRARTRRPSKEFIESNERALQELRDQGYDTTLSKFDTTIRSTRPKRNPLPQPTEGTAPSANKEPASQQPYLQRPPMRPMQSFGPTHLRTPVGSQKPFVPGMKMQERWKLERSLNNLKPSERARILANAEMNGTLNMMAARSFEDRGYNPVGYFGENVDTYYHNQEAGRRAAEIANENARLRGQYFASKDANGEVPNPQKAGEDIANKTKEQNASSL